MPRVNKVKADPKPAPSRAGGVVGRIAPIEFDDDDGIKIALYGASGTGKTTLWATFPKPILAIICSGHLQPGELRSIDTPEYRKTIHSVTLEQSREILDLADYVRDTGKYKTIVLDHGSGLQDLTLKEILGMDELPAQKSWGMATQQQYGQSTAQCKELLRKLLGLSCNVVIIAQERVFESEDNDEIIAPTVGPALTPSLTGWLNPAVDYIGQTFKRSRTETVEVKIGNQVVKKKRKVPGVDYCLRVGPDAVFTTKFRRPIGRGELPELLVNPTYDSIMSVIRAESEAEKR